MLPPMPTGLGRHVRALFELHGEAAGIDETATGGDPRGSEGGFI
jgi:hypothetical protein